MDNTDSIQFDLAFGQLSPHSTIGDAYTVDGGWSSFAIRLQTLRGWWTYAAFMVIWHNSRVRCLVLPTLSHCYCILWSHCLLLYH